MVQPKTAKEVIKKLGSKNICRVLSVGKTTVSSASVSGKFPASWFVILTELAAREIIHIPKYLFNWKGFTPPQVQNLENRLVINQGLKRS